MDFATSPHTTREHPGGPAILDAAQGPLWRAYLDDKSSIPAGAAGFWGKWDSRYPGGSGMRTLAARL